MGTLYDRYAPALFGILKRMVPSEDEAKDLLQDAFTKIWKKIGSYDPAKGRLFTWMLNITRNTGIDYLRSAAFRHTSKIQSEDSGVSMEKQGGSETINIDAIGLKDKIGKIDPDLQLVIQKLYFEGYTQSEFSKEYDVPLGTVKTRVRIAMRELRKLLI